MIRRRRTVPRIRVLASAVGLAAAVACSHDAVGPAPFDGRYVLMGIDSVALPSVVSTALSATQPAVTCTTSVVSSELTISGAIVTVTDNFSRNCDDGSAPTTSAAVMTGPIRIMGDSLFMTFPSPPGAYEIREYGVHTSAGIRIKRREYWSAGALQTTDARVLEYSLLQF